MAVPLHSSAAPQRLQKAAREFSAERRFSRLQAPPTLLCSAAPGEPSAMLPKAPRTQSARRAESRPSLPLQAAASLDDEHVLRANLIAALGSLDVHQLAHG
mmetsp:Transcript_1652/g.5648  ORF Transcript_1652/g.5648 Transcript_1652/m.5648 type:complete len:101 (+) Transcript_1652:101-403(+)